jgi:hypothetical protein
MDVLPPDIISLFDLDFQQFAQKSICIVFVEVSIRNFKITENIVSNRNTIKTFVFQQILPQLIERSVCGDEGLKMGEYGAGFGPISQAIAIVEQFPAIVVCEHHDSDQLEQTEVKKLLNLFVI